MDDERDAAATEKKDEIEDLPIPDEQSEDVKGGWWTLRTSVGKKYDETTNPISKIG